MVCLLLFGSVVRYVVPSNELLVSLILAECLKESLPEMLLHVVVSWLLAAFRVLTVLRVCCLQKASACVCVCSVCWLVSFVCGSASFWCVCVCCVGAVCVYCAKVVVPLLRVCCFAPVVLDNLAWCCLCPLCLSRQIPVTAPSIFHIKSEALQSQFKDACGTPKYSKSCLLYPNANDLGV